MKRSHRGVKTTIELPESIWRATKQRALDDDLDMRAVVIGALQAFLSVRSGRPKRRASRKKAGAAKATVLTASVQAVPGEANKPVVNVDEAALGECSTSFAFARTKSGS
jgi:hypothetical protein